MQFELMECSQADWEPEASRRMASPAGDTEDGGGHWAHPSHRVVRHKGAPLLSPPCRALPRRAGACLVRKDGVHRD